MLRLMALPVVVALLCAVLSCGGGEKKGTLPASGRQTPVSVEAKRAFSALEAELVENGGLVFENVLVDADSIFATIRLTDQAVEQWREAEKTLGRPPSLAWATVSLRFYSGGELSATHSMRFGQVRALSPSQPLMTVALSRSPMRGGGKPQPGLAVEGTVQCTVLAVRLQ